MRMAAQAALFLLDHFANNCDTDSNYDSVALIFIVAC